MRTAIMSKIKLFSFRKLSSLGYSSYNEYLRSDHWKDVKRRYFSSKIVPKDENGRFCCFACQRSDTLLNVHHKTYKRLGKERLHDLVLLCEECHVKAHIKHREHMKKFNKKSTNGLWAASNASIRSTRKKLKKNNMKSK